MSSLWGGKISNRRDSPPHSVHSATTAENAGVNGHNACSVIALPPCPYGIARKASQRVSRNSPFDEAECCEAKTYVTQGWGEVSRLGPWSRYSIYYRAAFCEFRPDNPLRGATLRLARVRWRAIGPSIWAGVKKCQRALSFRRNARIRAGEPKTPG